MTASLVFSLVGADRKGLVERLTQTIVQQGGNLEEARMAVLGGEFAVIMLVTVAADKRASIQGAMQETAGGLDMLMLCKETGAPAPAEEVFRFGVSVTGMDHEGIVHDVVHCLATHGGSIISLESQVLQAPHTATDLFSMQLEVEAPSALSMGDLRERLHEVARRLNVDVELDEKTAAAI